jgi:ATP-dependent helicase/nuclease subunit A
MREEAVSEARGVLESPELQWIFDQSALAEVSIHAEIAGKPLLGTIDRLIVRDDAIIAVDYKTNMAVPGSPDQCPEGLQRQMGAYAVALKQIYPDRAVETGILWTANRTYMTLPQNIVIEALSRATRLDGAPAGS